MHNVLQVGHQWWDTWQAQSVNRRIFSALLTVGALTALAMIASAFPHLQDVYGIWGSSDSISASTLRW